MLHNMRELADAFTKSEAKQKAELRVKKAKYHGTDCVVVLGFCATEITLQPRI